MKHEIELEVKHRLSEIRKTYEFALNKYPLSEEEKKILERLLSLFPKESEHYHRVFDV